MSEFEILGRVRQTSVERQVGVLDYLYDFDPKFYMENFKLNIYVSGFLFVKFFYFYNCSRCIYLVSVEIKITPNNKVVEISDLLLES